VTCPARRRPPRARLSRTVAATALLVVLGSFAASGCSGSDEPTPAEARMERVEARLGASFSRAQARCILDRADAELLRALDRSGTLEPDAPALAEWSDVLVGCVTDPDGTTTTSTEAPATSSTTAAGSLDPGVTTTTR
jgi:hypothetical protein